MSKRILMSWVGATDLRASEEEAAVGQGPVAQSLAAGAYDEAVLLYN